MQQPRDSSVAVVPEGMLRAGLVALLLFACGHGGGSQQSAPQHRDSGVAAAVAASKAPRALPAGSLGVATLEGFGWRKRAGQPAFRAARTAEAAGDWPAVVAACRQALAADPQHLEAAYLLAVALSKTGGGDELLGPLTTAVEGDFGKWGDASLEQPALQPWLATSTGGSWQQMVARDRAAYIAALGRAVIVNAAGDLYAFDPDSSHWLRLTRTSGTVVAAFRSPTEPRIAYVTRARTKRSATVQFGVGIVDLASGHTVNPTPINAGSSIELAWMTQPPSFVVLAGGAWSIDRDGVLAPIAIKAALPIAGATLEVRGHSARIRQRPGSVADVIADWDALGLASAIRVGAAKRAVTVPSPGLIDGATLAWSPDRTHIAFVVQLDDHCAKGVGNAGVFVADAATGTTTEIERAKHGVALEWLSDRRLAIAGDAGVTLRDLQGAPALAIAGATDLIAPRRVPKCTPDVETAPDDAAPPPDDDAAAGDEPSDAGVHGP